MSAAAPDSNVTDSGKRAWIESAVRRAMTLDAAVALGVWGFSLTCYVATLATFAPSTTTAQAQFVLDLPASSSIPVWIRYLQGILDAPDPHGVTAYSILTRALDFLPVSWRFALLSAVAASTATALLYGVLRGLASPRLVAALAAAAAALGSGLWSAAIAPGKTAVTAALMMAVAYSLLRWSRTKRAADLLVAAALTTLAAGNDPFAAIVLAGAAACAILAAPGQWRRPGAIVGFIVVGVTAALLQGITIVRILQGSPLLDFRGETAVAVLRRVAAGAGEIVWRGFGGATTITSALGRLERLLSAQAGMLGLCLAALGSLVLWNGAPHVLAFAAIVIAGFALSTAVWPLADPSVTAVPATLLGWILVGSGLKWVAEQGGVRRPRNFAVILAGCLVVVRVLGLLSFQLPGWGPISPAALDAAEHLPARAVLVAEDERADTHLLFALRDLARRDLGLIPDDAAAVAQYQALGYTLLARRRTREGLELEGFHFRTLVTPRDAGPTYAPWSQLTGRQACVPLGPVWIRIDPILLAAGARVTTSVPVVFYFATAGPWEPPVDARAGAPRLAVRVFSTSTEAGRQALDRSLRGDRLDPGELGHAEPWAHRVELSPSGQGEASEVLRLSDPPGAAFGVASGAGSARVCPVFRGDALFPDGGPEVARIPIDDATEILGRGWYYPEGAGSTTLRWTEGAEAEILPTLARTGLIRVRIDLMPALRDPRLNRVDLIVNGKAQQSYAVQSGPSPYEWTVVPAVWRQGVNRIVLKIAEPRSPASLGSGSDTRLLGCAVTAIQLELLQADPVG